MDKTTFQLYCDKLANMASKVPDWHKQPSSIIADYLREGTSYGFGQVLVRLLAPAYKIVKKYVEGGQSVSEDSYLYDLASLLSSTVHIDDYRFSAYYFAICVAAASFFGALIDESECESFDENELMKFDVTVPIQEEVDLQRKQLKKFSIRLLDFSRANQLVHFRPIKSTTMSLLSADSLATLHQVAKKSSKIYLASWKKLSLKMIFKCKICGRVEFHRYDFSAKKVQPSLACPVCDANNTHNRKSMVPLKEKLTCLPKDGYLCACGNRMSADELEKSALVCPQCGQAVAIEFAPLVSPSALKVYTAGEMVSAIGDTATNEVAKTLLNKAKNMERNFGLHVLYLACGFLKWKDTNGTEYNSPILLCPINLGVDKTKGQYYFEVDQSAEGAFEVNKTLLQMLSAYSKTCSISLPPLDHVNVGAYFSLMRQCFQNSNEGIREITKDWEIDAGFGIGLFHYQKLQLQHDIETNREKYLQHPIVRRLCGDENAAIDPPVLQKRNSTKYVMLDADSSQEEVIKAAQEGKSFILQGPPGSGKSQTITNIISSALGEGKTVLFVTEKTSARSVIIDNLLKCNVGGGKKLTDFVLDFDSFKKRGGAVGRNPFVTELNRCLIPYTPVGGYDDQLLAEEELRHGQIQEFMHQMRGEYGGRTYLRLLQDMAQYSAYKELDETRSVPTDRVEFTELCDTTSKYYTSVKNCGDSVDYKEHPLYGCKGDAGNDLYKIASEYKVACEIISIVTSALSGFGWNVDNSLNTLQNCVEQLHLWADMPKLTDEIVKNLNEKKATELLNRAKSRKETVLRLERHEGLRYLSSVDEAKFKLFDLKHAKVQSKTYRNIFKRLSKKYRAWLEEIYECFKTVPDKINYKSAKIALGVLEQCADYLELKATNEKQENEDISLFGYEPAMAGDFDDLIRALSFAKTIFTKYNKQVLDLQTVTNWALRFSPSQYSATINQLQTLEKQLQQAITSEKEYSARFATYVEASHRDFLAYRDLADNVIKYRAVLGDWYRLYATVGKITEKGWLPILNELIASKESDYENVKARLFRSYYQRLVCDFINANRLDYIRDFDRVEHEKLMASYSELDKRVLKTGAKRLYEVLNSYLKRAAATKSGSHSGEYPKLQSKTNYSIKQTILENWDYIKRIKPCFMMSPLNVSQYIDVDVRFDLVIFDEASQIFTEDALASIMRGKQVIIAGDSKQLPPCDFFRAGESIQDDDDQYFEEETNTENSLLSAADKALSDASISLAWHYRSCDEALIAFANKEMDYNLISFPSATRNANDGICYVSVPYAPNTCYVAGKSGTHINVGEADKIVELIYSEMTHPERKNFSIGVVAFSNAQAFEIETRWELFKQRPDKKAVIEQWEKIHEAEPLIFCNLDTVQGDERDITIISVCYSPDCNGKFTLPYLGRIRLTSGMKRINVAITRAKHRMIVVSTLKSYELKLAIQNSSAPEDNKAGAQMLCNFLEYAQSFESAMEVVCAKSYNPFVVSICKALDEHGVEYDTEIGRSECKINVGVRKTGEEGSFALGIIVDDPGRTDFDSVREYARLTEQVLSQKYGWKIYRVYPTAWVNDYERELQNLLEAVKQATAA